jgi:hypothetical protein
MVGRGRGIQAKGRVYGLRSTDLSLPLMPRLHGHMADRDVSLARRRRTPRSSSSSASARGSRVGNLP